MSKLVREPVKYIRDYIKKSYKVKDSCYICNVTENLELHHIFSLSELFHTWCTLNNIILDKNSSVDEILHIRENFTKDNLDKLSNDNLYTLCKFHHERLHNIYGQRYSNYLASKVLRWIELQKLKYKDSN